MLTICSAALLEDRVNVTDRDICGQVTYQSPDALALAHQFERHYVEVPFNISKTKAKG
jgi:hypothetical protein